MLWENTDVYGVSVTLRRAASALIICGILLVYAPTPRDAALLFAFNRFLLSSRCAVRRALSQPPQSLLPCLSTVTSSPPSERASGGHAHGRGFRLQTLIELEKNAARTQIQDMYEESKSFRSALGSEKDLQLQSLSAAAAVVVVVINLIITFVLRSLNDVRLWLADGRLSLGTVTVVLVVDVAVGVIFRC